MIYRARIFKIVLSTWYIVSKDAIIILVLMLHPEQKNNDKNINTIYNNWEKSQTNFFNWWYSKHHWHIIADRLTEP